MKLLFFFSVFAAFVPFQGSCASKWNVQELTEDLTGEFKPIGQNCNQDPSETRDTAIQMKDELVACAAEKRVCDIYFNPHTYYSYYKNPSAYGIVRSQLRFLKNQGQNNLVFTLERPSTSEIMNEIMILNPQFAYSTCENPYIGLLPEPGPCPLPKKAARATKVVVVYNPVTEEIILKSGLKMFLDPNLVAVCPFESCVGLSNLDVIGVHLHLGDEFCDGPPVVFFCGSAPLPAFGEGACALQSSK